MDDRLSNLTHLASRPADAWRAAGYWGQKPLWERIKEAATANPDRVAVIDDTGQLTTSELWETAQSIGRSLIREEVSRGDIVLVQLPNWCEFAQLIVGIEAAGAVLAFCPASWGPLETARALDLLRPKVWFVSGHANAAARLSWFNDSLGRASITPKSIVSVRQKLTGAVGLTTWLREPQPSSCELLGGSGLDPLEVAVTSGTTGDPKGVVHFHDSVLSTVQSTIDRQKISASDVIHVAIPVGHTFGYFYGVRCAMQAGATLLLQDGWDVERAAALVSRWRATVSLGPAACIIDLLSLPDTRLPQLTTLRLFTQSGDSLPQPVAERAAAKFSFRISRALGMTEFGHAASTDRSSPYSRVLDSAGSAQPGVTIEVRDVDGKTLPTGQEGRLYVAGPCLFAGYLKADSLDTSSIDGHGFFSTGDLGWIDETGYVHITGREKNVIRRGAVTIPTIAVESAITAHPSVSHAIIVPLPDSRLGEKVAACIQTKVGETTPSLDDVHAHLRKVGMTKTFWPSDMIVVEKWPLGPTGKIDRTALIARFLRKA
jgi:non-ribosomal peptide synthetase component E (peptide arylation enzyme)